MTVVLTLVQLALSAPLGMAIGAQDWVSVTGIFAVSFGLCIFTRRQGTFVGIRHEGIWFLGSLLVVVCGLLLETRHPVPAYLSLLLGLLVLCAAHSRRFVKRTCFNS